MNFNDYIENYIIELSDVFDFMRFTFVEPVKEPQKFLLHDGGLERPIFIFLMRDCYDSIGTSFLSMQGSPPRAYTIITNNYFLVFNHYLNKIFYIHTNVNLAPLTVEEKMACLSLSPKQVKSFYFIAYPDNSVEPIDVNKYKNVEIFTTNKKNPLIVPPKSLCHDRFLKIKEIKTITEFEKCIKYIQAWRECNL